MTTKKCTGCSEYKILDDFAKSERGLLGRKSRCKSCVSQYNTSYHRKRWDSDEAFREKTKEAAKDWTKNNPEKRAVIAKKRNQKAFAKDPLKIRARALVNQKVRFGRIPKASSLKCHCCGIQAKHYHHHNGYGFENRYDVTPLCTSCHTIIDK